MVKEWILFAISFIKLLSLWIYAARTHFWHLNLTFWRSAANWEFSVTFWEKWYFFALGLGPNNGPKLARKNPWTFITITYIHSSSWHCRVVVRRMPSSSRRCPSPLTAVDFWRLVYDHHSYCIVMLNEVDKADEVSQWNRIRNLYNVIILELILCKVFCFHRMKFTFWWCRLLMKNCNNTFYILICICKRKLVNTTSWLFCRFNWPSQVSTQPLFNRRYFGRQ